MGRKASVVEVENIQAEAQKIRYVSTLATNDQGREGKVVVHVIAAKDVVRRNAPGDAFVVVASESGEQQKTLPCKDCGDAPVWYERVELKLSRGQKTAFSAALYCNGWSGEPVLIGKLVVDYSAMIAEGRKVDAWLPLRDRQSALTGHLHLNISYVDTSKRKSSLPEAPKDLPVFPGLRGRPLPPLEPAPHPGGPETSRSFRNRRDIILEPTGHAPGLRAASDGLAPRPPLGPSPSGLSLHVSRPADEGASPRPAPRVSEAAGLSSAPLAILRPSLEPAPPSGPRASPRFRDGRVRSPGALEPPEHGHGAVQIRSNSISRTHGRPERRRGSGEKETDSPEASTPERDLARSVPDLRALLGGPLPQPGARGALGGLSGLLGARGPPREGDEDDDANSECSYTSR